MKMRIWSWIAIGCLLIGLSGCVNTVDGHKKLAVPFEKDKIESRYERPVDPIFKAAVQVLNEMGTVTVEDVKGKTLQAKVNTRSVWVRIDEVEPKVSRIVVQVRTSGGGGDVDLASEIDKRIALQLK
jgi:hypothetical protein